LFIEHTVMVKIFYILLIFLALAEFEYTRGAEPARDIDRAVVYTINETINSDYTMDLARKVQSDVYIRGWFKWRQAPPVNEWSRFAKQARDIGTLFGGGVTCSALYDDENGITRKQLLDMATRGSDGKLSDAWGVKGIRHGSLSSPVYIEYIMKWCREQIDAGADYLFMDEINAALGANEGFDDYSLRDFREFLREHHRPRKDWTDFDYIEYLKDLGLTANPHSSRNPLAPYWHDFRAYRDKRAWKLITDKIREYAKTRNRQVLISANGLAHHVDLQVLGVWGLWRVKNGRVDLTDNLTADWSSIVVQGRHMANRRVPVVFFHDWGFGNFPWLKVPPADRRLWMRVRGAEIYASGGFFAFPVHGPYGQDAGKDKTIGEIARQAAFYRRNRALYLDAMLLGFEPLKPNQKDLSLALWGMRDPRRLILHVINRRSGKGVPLKRKEVAVTIPAEAAPKSVRIISPDFEGEKTGMAGMKNGLLEVVLPELEAYSVALLDYDTLPRISMSGLRIVPRMKWARPEMNTFPVTRNGEIQNTWGLNAYLQGNLHSAMRNPPAFLTNMSEPGVMRFSVRAVATQGAKLVCRVDGKVAKTVTLMDRDGKNDGAAPEYYLVYEVPFQEGRHRITLQNVGKDWATVAWYAFAIRGNKSK
jgi:hypothetical protein